jgi:hypothetical protein
MNITISQLNLPETNIRFNTNQITLYNDSYVKFFQKLLVLGLKKFNRFIQESNCETPTIHLSLNNTGESRSYKNHNIDNRDDDDRLSKKAELIIKQIKKNMAWLASNRQDRMEEVFYKQTQTDIVGEIQTADIKTIESLTNEISVLKSSLDSSLSANLVIGNSVLKADEEKILLHKETLIQLEEEIKKKKETLEEFNELGDEITERREVFVGMHKDVGRLINKRDRLEQQIEELQIRSKDILDETKKMVETKTTVFLEKDKRVYSDFIIKWRKKLRELGLHNYKDFVQINSELDMIKKLSKSKSFCILVDLFMEVTSALLSAIHNGERDLESVHSLLISLRR